MPGVNAGQLHSGLNADQVFQQRGFATVREYSPPNEPGHQTS